MVENQGQQNNLLLTQEQVLREIYENTRKTKNYIKWQLIITVALVVIPFVMMIIILPMILSSVGEVYGGDSSSVLEQLQ